MNKVCKIIAGIVFYAIASISGMDQYSIYKEKVNLFFVRHNNEPISGQCWIAIDDPNLWKIGISTNEVYGVDFSEETKKILRKLKKSGLYLDSAIKVNSKVFFIQSVVDFSNKSNEKRIS